jgi:hypothetical protein
MPFFSNGWKTRKGSPILDEHFAEGFEWFVKEMVRIEPELASELDLPRSRYAQGVGRLEELIAVETELRR